MQFPTNPDDMLLSGVLVGGQSLAGRAQVVDAPVGQGHVVMFAIRPFWRWQTQGTYFLGFNTILNWNDLDAGRAGAPSSSRHRSSCGSRTTPAPSNSQLPTDLSPSLLRVLGVGGWEFVPPRGFDMIRPWPGRADVIVVGAGIIGCGIARELARRGARVRVFESRAVGAGATQASAGVLAPYIEASPRPVARPGHAQPGDVRRVSSAMCGRSLASTVEYRRCGTMEIARDAAEADRLETSLKSEHMSAAQAEWLDRSQARALEGTLPESVVGALLIKAHAYVAATQLTEALTWAALRHGTEVEAGRVVTSVADRSRDALVTASDGERMVG